MDARNFQILCFVGFTLVHGVISLKPLEDPSQDIKDNPYSDEAIIIDAIQQATDKAPNPDSDKENFATSLWGAFVFALIGIFVGVAILIFLLRFFSGSRSSSPKPPKTKTPKTRSTDNLVHDPHQNRNALANPNFVENPDRSYEQEPPQQHYPYTPASSDPYNEFPPASSTTYQPYSPEVTPIPVTYHDPPVSSSPVYARSSKSPQHQPSSQEPTFSYIDNYPPPSIGHSPHQATAPEEPFAYLDHYKPYTSDLPDDQTNLSEISTKRAVFRDSTPYQVIEERVQGEDYEDKYTFPENNMDPHLLNPKPSGPAKLSSDSFSDGKTRMVRVLPRFAPGTGIQNQHHNQQQMGGMGTAVFTPVAPPPPPPRTPPPPQYFGGQDNNGYNRY